MNHKDTKSQREPIDLKTNQISKEVVEAAYAVHRTLGPGLLESVYEICLAHELEKRGLAVERQVVLPVLYDNLRFDAGFRLDLLIEKCLIVELKTVDEILPIHKAQLLTYLKLSDTRLGLLINFNAPMIKDGLQRIIL
jgi:GxxExxY protein